MMKERIALAGMLAFVAVAAHAQETVEPKPLEASLALGVTVNDGNTDNQMYNGNLTIVNRYGDGNSSRLALDSNYGENDGDKTTDNSKAEAEYKHLISDLAYGTFNASYETDDIADLDYRYVIGAGLGCYLMKTDAAILSADVGPAYVGEKKSGASSTTDWALRVGERYERTMSTTAKCWQSLEYMPLFDDFDIYVINAEIGVEAPVSEKLNVRLVVKDKYDSNPSVGREYNDLSVIGALAYSLF